MLIKEEKLEAIPNGVSVEEFNVSNEETEGNIIKTNGRMFLGIHPRVGCAIHGFCLFLCLSHL
jgi:hypothetical protein